MAAPPLIQLTDIAARFGRHPLLDGADLAVSARERIALVGRNGSGKSTLLKITAGLIEPDRGTRFVQPSATIRYLAQEPDLSGHATTFAYVEAGLGPADDAHKARHALEQVGLSGSEETEQLSGGEIRRAAIAQALASDPDILLLDEPTNHLDLSTIEWLEATLSGLRAAIVLISHDRRFLENLSRATVWLDRGRAMRVDVGFGKFEAWRDAQLAEEEIAQHKLDRKIAMEEDWVRYGVTARRKRNVRRMANLETLRQQRRVYRASEGKAVIASTQAEQSGARVIEANGISKAFGGRAIVKDLSMRIMRGDRLGVIGPNGSGKTTLVNLLTGMLPPDSGEIRLGTNLQMASLDQKRESLDPSWTVSEALTGGRGDTVTIGGQTRHVTAYMKDFLFQAEQARTPLSVLSGGERGRLMLARALAKPSNLLVLDEPTNDLDMETLDVLEEMLGNYAGTLILISHDRDFLDRVVSSVIVPEGDGRWTEYAGGYSDMLAQRKTDVASRKPVVRETVREKAPAPIQPRAAKRKLSFHEKHALETLPDEMAKLQAIVRDLQAQLADPDLYARDRDAFGRATDALSQAQAQLATAEERWLELEILREEIESG